MDNHPKPEAGRPDPGESTIRVADGPVNTPVPIPTLSPPQALAEGEVVAGRYRVIRMIGRGGMGEVHEVEDLELGARVALKAIRSDASWGNSQEALERLKREINLARRVSHPGVCRIFDIGRHEREGDGQRPITFLTMELLHGRTLAELLNETKRLPMTELRPIATQLADALAAAHAAGVVHRDLKPGNIMLVPQAGMNDATNRTVILDFGLARSVQAGAADVSLTARGLVMGTAAYMAPEQVTGGAITPAVDIYALGLILYEMATGARPFEGDSPLSTATRRLTETPVRPRSLATDLPQSWDDAIMRCLEREPAARIRDVRDVIRIIGATGRRRRRMRNVILGAVCAIAVIGAVAVSLMRRAPASFGRGSRPSVAVLPFTNQTGAEDTAWLATALAEMLLSELAAGDAVRSIPGETVARAMMELSRGADSGTAAGLGKIVGADYVVTGSFIAIGVDADRRLRIDTRLWDPATGEMLLAVPSTGTDAALFDLARTTGAVLRQRLGVQDDSRSRPEREPARSSVPSSADAMRQYAEGLARLRLQDAMAAIPLLQESIDLDPRFPLAHAALAEAWTALGYEAKARDSARAASELSSGLDRSEKLLVEARYRSANREWAQAIELYGALFRFYPDDIEYGLRLAETQTAAGNGEEALATVGRLREIPSPDGEDPRIDLAESVAAGSISDYTRQLAAARRAVMKADASGARLIAARARLREGVAHRNMGRLDQAFAAADRAREVFKAVGDRSGVAWATNNMGAVLMDQGKQEEARRSFEEVLAIYRDLGDRSGVALALGNVANVASARGNLSEAREMLDETIATYREIGDQHGAAWALNEIAIVKKAGGDLAGARAAYDESLKLYREVGDKSGVAGELGNIANLVRASGDLAAGRKLMEEAIAITREIGDQSSTGTILINLGDTSAAEGELDAAQRCFDEALAISRELGVRSYEAYCLSGLGEVQFARGDLDGARRRHEEALRLREALGERSAAAESRVALAAIALELGLLDEAERVARESASLFESEQIVASQAQAAIVETRVLLERDALPAAVAAAARAERLAESSQDAGLKLQAGIESARVKAARGEREEARRAIERAMRRADELGFVSLRLAATLELGRIESATAATRAAGRKRLAALGEEARSKGFGLIAKKAGEGSR